MRTKTTYLLGLSRRQWLASASTLTAAAGAGLLAGNVSASEPDKTISSGSPGARVYDVRDFGAKGDGQTTDTRAVQAAIDACHQDQGGTVLVPAGVFVIGTVELKSSVTLHIAAQSKLLGSGDGKQYHAVETIPMHGDTTLEDGNVALLFAANAENITVEGPGTIDGQGDQFHDTRGGLPPPAGISGNHRPYHLLFYRCQNLTVRNIRLTDSAYHSVRIIESSYIYLTGIHIHSRRIPNSDGFHFISSEYVHISNCDVQSQDDACALFGSCKFVTVTNSSFSTRWSVFRFGGGVAENITISNCLIYETYGCPIKMRCEPNSRFENISFSNLVMVNVTGPISIGACPRENRRPAAALFEPETNAPATTESAPAPEAPAIVRNISFNGIHATVVKPVPLPDAPFGSAYNPGENFSCITLNAVGESVMENITFNDLRVTFPGGGTAAQAAVRDVPQVVGEYYDMGIPPAYALFARNVRGLTLQSARFELAAPDLRPAMVFDHVEDAAINGFSVDGDPAAESVLRFINSREVLLNAVRLLEPGAVFLQVEGAGSGAITLDGGDIRKAATPLAWINGATEHAVTRRT